MYKKIMQDAKTIYSWLNDDESRNIFVNRLAWLISGEERYLDSFRNATVGLKYPQVRGTGAKKLIQRVKELSQPVIIYGGGGIGTGVFELLRQEGIMPKCFWDKDERKQSVGVCGTLTQAPGTDLYL